MTRSGRTAPRQRLADMPPAQQAGILCNDARFQAFAAMQCGCPGGQLTETATTDFLRSACGVTSRKTLDTDPDARSKLNALRTDFDAWTGKLPAPR